MKKGLEGKELDAEALSQVTGGNYLLWLCLQKPAFVQTAETFAETAADTRHNLAKNSGGV